MDPNWLHLTIGNHRREREPNWQNRVTYRHIPKSAELSGRLKAQEPLIKFSINVKLGSRPKPISAGKIGFRRSALSKMWVPPARIRRSMVHAASQLIQPDYGRQIHFQDCQIGRHENTCDWLMKMPSAPRFPLRHVAAEQSGRGVLVDSTDRPYMGC